jgi:DedD protein
MRFEIKSGGLTAILLGIAALSGAVFMLGLLAGYDVGRESQTSAAQVATDYPVSPPASGETAAASGAAGSAAAVSAIAMPSPNPAAPATRRAPLASAKPPPPSHVRPAAAVSPSSERLATAASPPTGGVSALGAGADTADESGGGSESGGDAAASAPPPPVAHAAASAPGGAHARHKPFNIQIQAAMDRSGANEIVQRLHALGYQPHLTPVQLNGQTWYKVVIGPYPTQEAAAAAQQEMRTKYNNIYGGGAAGAGASNPGANPSANRSD